MRSLKPPFVIFIAVLFQYSCGNAINPVLAPLAMQTGMSTVQTGLFFTLSSLMWLVASPFWSRKSETLGRKNVMLIGLGSCGFLYLSFGLVGDWGLSHRPNPMLLFSILLLIRLISGLFFSTVPIASQAYIADTTHGNERTVAVSLIWMASGLGSIIGPGIGVFSSHHLMNPLYIGSVLPLVGFLGVFLCLPNTQATRISINNPAVKVKFLDRRVWKFLFMVASLQASVLGIQVTTGFFVESHFHLTASQTAETVGLLFMLTGVVSVTSQLIFVRQMKLSSKMLLFIGTPTLLLCSISLMFHAFMVAVYAGFILLGVGIGFVLPGATSGASLAVKQNEQGAIAGRISASQGLGTAVGPLVGTNLYNLNHLLPYVFVGLLFSIASVFSWSRSSYTSP